MRVVLSAATTEEEDVMTKLNRALGGGTLLILLASACSNPTVDPAAVFAVEGKVTDADGQPLQGAEVRLIKYYSDLNVFHPSAEILFSDAKDYKDDVITIQEVHKATTDADGRYEIEATGAELANPDGVMTAMGFVEVANTIVVVRDPSDTRGEAGVYTYKFVFQQATKIINNGTLDLWKAEAQADTGSALTTGQIEFKWNKLANPTSNSEVSNIYRMTISGEATPTSTMIVRCNDSVSGDVQGGCDEHPTETGKLRRTVSAFSVAAFYSDPNGAFVAYIEGNGANNRYRAKFQVTAPVVNILDTRDQVDIDGIWAVGVGADQSLKGTAADDGDPATRETINNSATAIYVKLASPVPVTDGGILNTLLQDAAKSCVIVEFTVDSYTDIAAAKQNADSSSWTRKGKFCGENGARNEISALASFDTTASDGVTAAWMRLKAEPDGSGANPAFRAVGEVGVYRKAQQ